MFEMVEGNNRLNMITYLEGDKLVTVPIIGNIEFRNVSFGYFINSNHHHNNNNNVKQNNHHHHHYVLKNVSFKIPAGETVALVGASGSGKSTIIKLLTRLYDVSEGSITIDGIDIRQLPLSEVRRHLGVVSQESVLFDETVKQNIKYGKLNASDESMQEAAQLAQVHQSVTSRSLGYETRVGERGSKLSV
jgi:ABC-type multidrug transport system fused ATPase/permease subunit